MCHVCQYTLQVVTINYYSSNINKLLISLIKIDGCYNLNLFFLYQFHNSFYQILFCQHSAFYAEVSQSVCKPNQITEFSVIPMIQKVSNCRKYWVEIELARNKMKSTQKQASKGVKIKLTKKNLHLHTHTRTRTHTHMYTYIMQMILISNDYLVRIIKS